MGVGGGGELELERNRPLEEHELVLVEVKRVFVVWNAFEPYTGTITKYDPFKNNPFFVESDDGEKQWEAAEDVRPIGAFIVLD